MKLDTKWLAIFIIILQATHLFVPVAMYAGLGGASLVSAALTLLSAIYIYKGKRFLGVAVNHKIFVLWLIAILILPLLIILIQVLANPNSESNFYWIRNIIGYSALFIMAVIFAIKSGEDLVKKVYISLALIIGVSFLINIIFPQIIYQNLRFLNIRIGIITGGRPTGFFPHMNTAALSSVCIMFVLMVLKSRYEYLTRLAVALSFLVIIMTGSRTSLLLALIIIFGVTVRSFKDAQNIRLLAKLYFKAVFLIFAASFCIYILYRFTANPAIQQSMQRMFTALQFVTGNQVADASLSIRGGVLDYYFNLSMERPFLGFGPNITESVVDAGKVSNVSQNLWLQWAVEYGYFYVLFVAACTINGILSSNFMVRSFLILFVFMSFSFVQIFFVRAFLVTFGIIIGLSIRKRMDVQQSASAQVISGPQTSLPTQEAS